MNLPINETIQPGSVAMPPAVLKELITRAGHLHVLDICPCRLGNGCTNHPHDLGCLLLGETGLDVVPQMSRPVTQDEALAHVDRAIGSGLVPMIARMRADNYLFLTPDRHTLIAACFCCHCCCGLSSCRLVQPAKLGEIFHKPEGLVIEVSDRCIGCGACMETCYMQAIRIENGRARHGDRCLGCGRCAGTCPRGAVDIRLTDPAYLGKTVEKYLSLAKID